MNLALLLNGVDNSSIDLLFLIAKYLETYVSIDAAKPVYNKIEESGNIPLRYDWLGNTHKSSLTQWIAHNSHISADFLLKLCSNTQSLLYKCFSCNGISPSLCHQSTLNLLMTGSHSLLRSCSDTSFVFTNLSQMTPRVNGRLFVDSVCLRRPPNQVFTVLGRELRSTWMFSHAHNRHTHSRIRLVKRTLGHLSAVYCCTFDRTGFYIITGADDCLVKVWSSRSGRLLATLRGASLEISDLAISPDNVLLAAGSCDKIIRVWDLNTTAPVAVLTGHSGIITALGFCPGLELHQRLLVSTSNDGCVAFWRYNYNQSSSETLPALPCTTNDSIQNSVITAQENSSHIVPPMRTDTSTCERNVSASVHAVTFDPSPVMVNEKVRPGCAQLLCLAFSPGGAFLALGGADHYVRVYLMTRLPVDGGPERILETEAHTDCVDSLHWSYTGCRFVSGSKDGSAIVWTFEQRQWKQMKLVARHIPGFSENYLASDTMRSQQQHQLKPLKVTMVRWSRDDRHIFMSVSDFSFRVWDSTFGIMLHCLSGHKDEFYTIDGHPSIPSLALTAGHDGKLIIWDVFSGEIVTSHHNTIENEGHGCLFDGCWSPDGLSIVTTDSHGHFCYFSIADNQKFAQTPYELFFHTDYRPLVSDARHQVLDEQTQLAPHLMPHPFLVDAEGRPYDHRLQSLVPGRQPMSDNSDIQAYLYSISDNLDFANDNNVSHIASNGSGSIVIPSVFRAVSSTQRSPFSTHTPIGQHSSSQSGTISASSLLDEMIERLAAENQSSRAPRGDSRGVEERVLSSHSERYDADYMTSSVCCFKSVIPRLSDRQHMHEYTHRKLHADIEITTYTRELSSGSNELEKQHQSSTKHVRHRMSLRKQSRVDRKHAELSSGRQHGTSGGVQSSNEASTSRVCVTTLSGRSAVRPELYGSSYQNADDLSLDELSDDNSSSAEGDRQTSSSDYSDWGGEQNLTLYPPQRLSKKQIRQRHLLRKQAKSRQVIERQRVQRGQGVQGADCTRQSRTMMTRSARLRRRRILSDEASTSEERTVEPTGSNTGTVCPDLVVRLDSLQNHGLAESDHGSSHQSRTTTLNSRPSRKKAVKVDITDDNSASTSSSSSSVTLPHASFFSTHTNNSFTDESAFSSSWLSELYPKKTPYFPQMGDELVYFVQGHKLYTEAVQSTNLYDIQISSLPWNKCGMHSFKDVEYVKVIGIKFELLPPCLCCLKLSRTMSQTDETTSLAIDSSTNSRMSTFTVKYHDMEDVVDFFVLRSVFESSTKCVWNTGDVFRSSIDDTWWYGRVKDKQAFESDRPQSPFLCYRIVWSSGEVDTLSVWDMEVLSNENKLMDAAGGEDEDSGLPHSHSQTDNSSRAVWPLCAEDWLDSQPHSQLLRIQSCLSQLMEMSVAEPFLAPVDLNLYPTYALVIAYPVDLTTIKSRVENCFYRRLSALLFDVRYLASNAEKFNQPHSKIVRSARIVTDTLLTVVVDKDCTCVRNVYQQMVARYSPNTTTGATSDQFLHYTRSSSSSSSSLAVGHHSGRCAGSHWQSSSSSRVHSVLRRACPSDSHNTHLRSTRRNFFDQSWQQHCSTLLDSIVSHRDSLAFRQPVDLDCFADYTQVIDCPIDLSFIRTHLDSLRYHSPEHFASDIRLMFSNAKTYNTDKRSQIYTSTLRLSGYFEMHMTPILNYYGKNQRPTRQCTLASDKKHEGSAQSHTDTRVLRSSRYPKFSQRSTGNIHSAVSCSSTSHRDEASDSNQSDSRRLSPRRLRSSRVTDRTRSLQQSAHCSRALTTHSAHHPLRKKRVIETSDELSCGESSSDDSTSQSASLLLPDNDLSLTVSHSCNTSPTPVTLTVDPPQSSVIRTRSTISASLTGTHPDRTLLDQCATNASTSSIASSVLQRRRLHQLSVEEVESRDIDDHEHSVPLRRSLRCNSTRKRFLRQIASSDEDEDDMIDNSSLGGAVKDVQITHLSSVDSHRNSQSKRTRSSYNNQECSNDQEILAHEEGSCRTHLSERDLRAITRNTRQNTSKRYCSDFMITRSGRVTRLAARYV